MIKIIICTIAVTSLMSTCFSQTAPVDLSKRTKQDTLDAWQKDRFGIFIHWGASSVLDAGAGSWCRADNNKVLGNKTASEAPDVIKSGAYLSRKGRRPIAQEIYDNLHHVFNPEGFDATEWAKLFKEAGAGYIVFTAKHHDGFCMFDTQTQDYKITNTPFKRDICKELADACRAEGVRVFWYYSPVDWWHPDWKTKADTAYEDDAFLPQVEELVSNYGPIEGIWWDGGQITKKYADQVVALIKEKQPWALLNPRLGGGAPSDFETPEQKLGEFNMKRRWESCMTMTGPEWFWNGGKKYKSTETSLKTLIACAVGDGNLLLDVGPRADGRIDERAAETYRTIGTWLKQYGQSIRGTRGGPYKPGHWGGSTRNGNKVYLHITQVIEDGKLVLPALPVNIVDARCLTGGEVEVNQTESQLIVTVSKQASVDTLVELTLTSDSMAIEPIETDSKHSLTDNAVVKASSLSAQWPRNNTDCLVHHAWEKGGATLQFGEPGYEEQQAALARKPSKGEGFSWVGRHLGHHYRFWQAEKNDKDPWLELEFTSEKTFSQIYLWESYGYSDEFAFDAMVDGKWETIFADNGGIGFYNRKLKESVTTTKVRVRFIKSTGPVAMFGIMLYK